MRLNFPSYSVGSPKCHESLAVFPLYQETSNPVEYVLADKAIEAGDVVVSEVSESGSVPDLIVDNSSEFRVLFLEGEELVGAKQNRVLNASALIGARSRVKVPVSCVEQGRWSYSSDSLSSSGLHAPSGVRSAIKRSVSASLRAGRGHSSDQGRVWSEVERQQQSLDVSSESIAMSDTFRAHEGRLSDIREQIVCPQGANGVAVTIEEKIVALELFDRPSTLEESWNRLVSGFILDALEAAREVGRPEPSAVEELLDRVVSSAWEQVDAVAAGQEYRSAETDAFQASALCFEGALIHMSVVAIEEQ